MADTALRPEDDQQTTPDDIDVARGIQDAEDYANQGQDDTDINSNKPSDRLRLPKVTRKHLIWAGGGTGIVGLLVAAFLTLLPLKIEHIVKNISSRAFATAENAIEHRAETLLVHYVRKAVFPGIRTCGTTRNAGCGAGNLTSSSLAGKLYDNWRLGKFEQKLWEKQGIAFEYNSTNNRYSIITRKGTTDILDPDNFKLDVLQSDARAELRTGLKKVTKWNQVYKRHQLFKLARIKYNYRRWNVFGQQRDALRQKYHPIKRVQMATVQKVVAPLSGRYGVYLTCLIDGCDSESDFVNRLTSVTEREAAEEVVDALSSGEKGKDFLIRKALEPLLLKLGVAVDVNALPVIGQAISAIMVLDMVERLDTAIDNNAITRYTADLHRFQYASYFLDLATFSDEMKSGELKIEEVGAKAELIGEPGKSRIYQREFLNNPDGNPEVICDDGSQLAVDKMICDEKLVIQRSRFEKWRDNNVVDFAITNGILGKYRCILEVRLGPIGGCTLSPRDEVRGAINSLEGITGAVINGILSALEKFPVVGPWLQSFQSWSNERMMSVVQHFFKPVLTGIERDGEAFDAAYGGGLVVANDFTKGDFDDDGSSVGIGGEPLSTSAINENRAHRLAIDAETNRSESWWGRLFSPQNSRSLTTRLAMIMPASFRQASHTISTTPNNMIAIIGRLFSPAVSAANTSSNPFKILEYGYDLNSLELAADPETYTSAYCDAKKQERENSMEDLDTDGIPDYTMTNPCMLEEAAIDSLGSFLTEDSDNTSQPAPLPPGTVPTGSAQELAQQILNTPNIAFNTPQARQAVEDTANGQAARVSCSNTSVTSANLSPLMLGAWLKAAEQYFFTIGYITNGCHGANSAHYKGRGFDVNLISGKQSDGLTQLDKDFSEYLARFLPAGSGIGQQQCSAFMRELIAPGMRRFNDTCNHLHFDLP